MPSEALSSEGSTQFVLVRRPTRYWHMFAAVSITIAATAGLVALAYYTIFSTMRCFDDEGYAIIQVYHFLNGWPLYDEIVSLYGPSYFFFARLGFSLFPIGDDGTRLLTIGSLMISAMLSGVCVLGLTRRPAISICAGLLVGLRILPSFADEPGHPQVVVTMLIAAIATVLAWWNPRRPIFMGGMAGILVASLAMTKINVGVYAAISVFISLLMACDEGIRLARPLNQILIIGSAFLPLALIKSRLNSQAGALQAIFYVAPLFAVLLTVVSPATKVSGPRIGIVALLSYILGGVIGTIAFCGFAMQSGATLQGVLNGIALMPLRMAGVFGTGPWIADSLPEAGLSLIIASGYYYYARRGWRVPAVMTAFLKLAFAASVIAAVITGVLGVTVAFYLKMWGVSLVGWGLFLWILLIRLPKTDGVIESEGDEYGVGLPRLGLALVAALQPLQSYPVAGSQSKIGTMLMIPAALVCVAEVMVWAERVVGRNKLVLSLLQCGQYVAVFALICFVGMYARTQLSVYEQLTPLGLKETSRLRTTERQVAGTRWLEANVEQSCSTFLAPTGFNSLYLWANKEPASRISITDQVYMFSESQQRKLLETLEASTMPLVLYHDNYFASPEEVATSGKSLLLSGMTHDFIPYGPGTVEGYTLRYKSGKPKPEMFEYAVWEGFDGSLARTALIDVLPKADRSLARIVVAIVGGMSIAQAQRVPRVRDVILADSAAALTADRLEAFSESGEPIRWPLPLNVRRKITIKLRIPAKMPLEPLVVARLVDEDARWITSVPFVTPFAESASSVSDGHKAQ